MFLAGKTVSLMFIFVKHKEVQSVDCNYDVLRTLVLSYFGLKREHIGFRALEIFEYISSVNPVTIIHENHFL